MVVRLHPALVRGFGRLEQQGGRAASPKHQGLWRSTTPQDNAHRAAWDVRVSDISRQLAIGLRERERERNGRHGSQRPTASRPSSPREQTWRLRRSQPPLRHALIGTPRDVKRARPCRGLAAALPRTRFRVWAFRSARAHRALHRSRVGAHPSAEQLVNGAKQHVGIRALLGVRPRGIVSFRPAELRDCGSHRRPHIYRNKNKKTLARRHIR